MKQNLTRLVCSLVAASCIPTLSYAAVTTLDISKDCDQFNKLLTDAHSVVAVHHEGCSFGPALEAISNKFTQFSFYQIEITMQTHVDNVCGKVVNPNVTIFNGKPDPVITATESTAPKKLESYLTTQSAKVSPAKSTSPAASDSSGAGGGG